MRDVRFVRDVRVLRVVNDVKIALVQVRCAGSEC